MPLNCARSSHAIRMISLCVLSLLSGCGGGSPLGRAGIDSLSVPTGWTPTRPDYWEVPGVPISAWKGPNGSSFVVYRELSTRGDEPASLARRIANRYENLPGLTLLASNEIVFSGMRAAKVEAVAAGTGAAFLPTGTGVPVSYDGLPHVPTRRILIAVPRGWETLAFLWHVPEAEAAEFLSRIGEFRIDMRPKPPSPRNY